MHTNLANNVEINNLYNSSIEEIADAAGTTVKAVLRFLELDRAPYSEKKDDPDFQKIVSSQIILATMKETKKIRRYKVSKIMIETINTYLNENKEKIKNKQSKLKKNYTQIHNCLLTHGFQISYCTTCRVIKELENKKLEAFIKCAYSPGEYSEFDWSTITLTIGGFLRRIKAGVFTSAYSDNCFAQLYEKEDTSSFVDVHNSYFESINGVFKTVVYDNMSLAVNHKLSKRNKKVASTILKEISSFYKFNYRFCNVRSPNEKPHVEKKIDVINKNIFALKSDFSSIEEANLYLQEQLTLLNNKENPYNNKSCKQRFQEERGMLLPFTSIYYHIQKSTRKVTPYSYIQFQNNYYSVPIEYVGKIVLIHHTAYTLTCFYNGNVIASHVIGNGVNEYSLSLQHHIDMFYRKPGGFLQSLLYKNLPALIKETFVDIFKCNTREFVDYVKKHLMGNNLMIEEKLQYLLSKLQGLRTKEKLISLSETMIE